ncbi:MAG: processive 1,2-diacylglycerol beta-glucosyltransferase [Solirubrobacteraceae bacterium]|jgi:UDP-N-acetylglucosamine:LPS N-acetylglucosamine transferase|nr:processive 1,2-diacylglycerol beta-glucosyltransferase [Solirubrobacteraceae bacterium]
MTAPRVLILSASIGEGHDLPARVLADGLALERPDVHVRIEDGLLEMGWPIDRVVMGGSRFDSRAANVFYDIEYWCFTYAPPVRGLGGWLLDVLGGRGLLRLIEQERPDVIVSTYPGVTESLGRMRRRGALAVPVASAITDLAALRYWAHPGVDLHLITHRESTAEVRSIAPDSRIAWTNGLTSPEFLTPRDPTEARADLGLPPDGPIVAVSGGGWAVGDLAGAAEVALRVPDATVVCLCGRNDELRERLERDFAGEPRLRAIGFTDRMGDWLAAADALVHSTAGLTVLEAIIRGCAVVSYGWGRGHIRVNNHAYRRFGLAEVATTPAELGEALRRALASRPAPDLSYAQLRSAASAVLELARR